MKRLILLALFGCSHAKDQPSPIVSTKPVSVKWAEASDRLLAMSDNGWVVSRFDDGRLEHQGDSLIWTGVAMGTLDCERGGAPEAALLAMLKESGGKLWRHPSLKDDWSLDGAIGLYYGIIERARRCPGARLRWGDPLKAHAAAVKDDPRLTPRFEVLLEEALSAVGAGVPADESARGELGAEVATWAAAVVTSKSAAFRLHLGWLTLSTMAAPKGRDAYCAVVGDAKVALLENFCGRDGLPAWVDAFQYDRMEYAHQRAAWEAEAVVPGLHTPGLDLLVALREIYLTDAALLD